VWRPPSWVHDAPWSIQREPGAAAAKDVPANRSRVALSAVAAHRFINNIIRQFLKMRPWKAVGFLNS
jgi:hypothetical protein